MKASECNIEEQTQVVVDKNAIGSTLYSILITSYCTVVRTKLENLCLTYQANRYQERTSPILLRFNHAYLSPKDKMNNRPVEQSLNTLLPTHANDLPPELVSLASSLVAQSRSFSASLKPEEEIARPYACAEIACRRYANIYLSKMLI